MSTTAMAYSTLDGSFHFKSNTSQDSLPSKRSSTMSASTTKSQLRASNVALIDMLQNIQAELFAHRSIMLDIQSRVSHLEQQPKSPDTIPNNAARTEKDDIIEQLDSRKSVGPDASVWWEACRNFARNSDPPMSAGEFLKTPRPVSSMVPSWEQRFSASTNPTTPPETPKLGQADLTQEEITYLALTGSTNKTKTVEIEVKELPPPPHLGPVPGHSPASSVSGDSEELETEASSILEPEPEPSKIETPQPTLENEDEQAKSGSPSSEDLKIQNARFINGKKSLSSFQAIFKHKKTDKEHKILIHLHHRSQFKDETPTTTVAA